MNEDEREETRAETKSAKPTSNSRHADTERSPRPFHACAHPSVCSIRFPFRATSPCRYTPLCLRLPPLLPSPTTPPDPPLSLITTLIHHHRGGLHSSLRAPSSPFVPILFFYPPLSPLYPFVSLVEKRKETLAFPSPYHCHVHFSMYILAHLFLNLFSDSKDQLDVRYTSNSG